MAFIEPDKIREKLLTARGRDAFERLNALGPRWVYFEEAPGKVYLSPTIETKAIGDGMLSSAFNGWAGTYDEAAINVLEALQRAAGKANRLVVVNAGTDDRAEFVYDKASATFEPWRGLQASEAFKRAVRAAYPDDRDIDALLDDPGRNLALGEYLDRGSRRDPRAIELMVTAFKQGNQAEAIRIGQQLRDRDAVYWEWRRLYGPRDASPDLN